MKIEVLGTERRRRWSLQDKLQIVEETMQPGVTVTEVARRHGLAPSVVFTWRRLAREGRLGDAGPSFMPVEITPLPRQATPVASPPRRTGLIEIVLGAGAAFAWIARLMPRRCGGCCRWWRAWHDSGANGRARVVGHRPH